MAKDYINNLKDPLAFQRMVARLSENLSYQSLTDDRKMKLLNKLASKREQKPVLQGEVPEVASGVTAPTDAKGEGVQERPSGVASEASGQRVVEGLVGLGEEAALQGAVTGGAAMALGGLDLDQALGMAFDPAVLGKGVLMGVPDVIQSGMGLGRDLGTAGAIGKGILSMALGAVNPALGVVANVFGTTIADTAMDWLGARGFEEQKDNLENVVGELGARSGIDYGSLEGIEAQGSTFQAMRDNYAEMLQAGVQTGSITAEEAERMQGELAALDAAARFEDKAFTTMDYELAIGAPQVRIDEVERLGSKLREYGVDPTKLSPYQELSGFDKVFGKGAYERASLAAKEKHKLRTDTSTARQMGITKEELDKKRSIADKYGLKVLTGTAMAEAERKEREQVEKARKEQQAFDRYKGNSDGGSYDPRGGPVGGTSGGRHDTSKGISWGGSSGYKGNSDGNGGGGSRGGGSSSGDRESSPGGMGGV